MASDSATSGVAGSSGLNPDQSVSDEASTESEESVSQDEVKMDAGMDMRSTNSASDFEVNTSEDEASTIEDELAQVKDQLLRISAEFQNYRRRTDQSRIQDTALGKSIVLQQVLGVFDDLGRSLDAARDLSSNPDVDVHSSYEALRSGMNLVYKNFSDELKRLGLREIDAVGKPFDESLHEALLQQPAEDGVEPGTVLAEVQKGYLFGDRVLRHSKVIVAQ